MTLERALRITTIREDELKSINPAELEKIIANDENRVITTAEMLSLEAFKTILNHIKKGTA